MDWSSLPVRFAFLLVLLSCHSAIGSSVPTYRHATLYETPTDSDTSSATTSLLRRRPELTSVAVPSFPFKRRFITQPPTVTTVWAEITTPAPVTTTTEFPSTTSPRLRIKLRKRVKIRRLPHFYTTTVVPFVDDYSTTPPSTFGTRLLPTVTQRGQSGLRDVSTTPLPKVVSEPAKRQLTSRNPTPNPFIPATSTEVVTTTAKESNKTNEKDDDDEETKSLAMEVESENGKYGLIHQLFPAASKNPPGVISYAENEETPNDVSSNLGGMNPDDIWLSEGHLLVLKGGSFPSNYQHQNGVWLPLDNYQAPKQQVKVPFNPRVPPPFPINVNDTGPPVFLGRPPPQFFYPPPYGFNDSDGQRPSFLPPPPGFFPPPPFRGNGTGLYPPGPFPGPYPGAYPPPPGNGTGLYGPPTGPGLYGPPTGPGLYGPPTGPGLYGPPSGPGGPFPPFRGNGSRPFPPGRPFPPFGGPPFPFPPGGNNSFPPPNFNGSAPTEPIELPPSKDNLTDDPSVLYPPPYDFYYPMDNTTHVPPGPFAPGLIVPPPPDFFKVVNDSSLFPDTSSDENSSYDEDYSYYISNENEDDGINSLSGPPPTPITQFNKVPRTQRPPSTRRPIYNIDQLVVTPPSTVKPTVPVRHTTVPARVPTVPVHQTTIQPLNELYEDYIRKNPVLGDIYRQQRPFKITPVPQVTTTPAPITYTRGKDPHSIVFPGPTPPTPSRKPHRLYHYLTRPTPATSTTVIPLDSDILVNQRPQRPGINPDSEPIHKPKGYYVLIPNQPDVSGKPATATLYYVIPENNKVFLFQPRQQQQQQQNYQQRQDYQPYPQYQQPTQSTPKSPLYYVVSGGNPNDKIHFPGQTNRDYQQGPQQVAYPSTENPSFYPSPYNGYDNQRFQNQQPYYYYASSTERPSVYRSPTSAPQIQYGQRAGPLGGTPSNGHVAFHRSGPGGYKFQIDF